MNWIMLICAIGQSFIYSICNYCRPFQHLKLQFIRIHRALEGPKKLEQDTKIRIIRAAHNELDYD